MKIKVMIGIAVVVVAIIAGVFLKTHNKKYKTVIVEKTSIVEAIYGQGIVKSEQVYNLKVGVTTGIDQVFVTEGQAVAKGDKLIKMDEALFTAPFAGVVMSIPNKKLETVYSQNTLLTLVSLEDTFVEVSLEQQSFIKVIPKQKVRLSFEGLRGEIFYGEVLAKYNQGNQFLVKVAVKLPASIFPNMSLDSAIILSEKTDALVSSYVAIKNGKVLKLVNGKAEEIEVTTGLIDEDKVELISQKLQPGDQLVVQ